MMTNHNDIPTSELFADLQVSLTEIFLIELLDDDSFVADNRSRLNGNYQIRDAIRGIMKERFTPDDISNFLKNGYPRAVDLRKSLVG